MALNSTINRNLYIGNGNTKTYNYGFKIFDEADLEVIQTNTDNVETTLSLGSVGSGTYTVTGVGNENGGSITLNSGNLPNNYKLTIIRNRQRKQGTDIKNQGPYFPEIHENALDSLAMIDQSQQDEINRAIKVPKSTDLSSVSINLPAPSANKFLMWNSSGTAIENKDITDIENTVIGSGLTLSGNTLSANTASDTQKGIIEIATNAEVSAASAADRAVTPSGLASGGKTAIGLSNVSNDEQIKSSDFPSASVDGEIVLFSGTTGKIVKRASITGLLKASAGVIAQAVAGTDYLTPTGDGSGLTGISIADSATSINGTVTITAAQCTGRTKLYTTAATTATMPAATAGLTVTIEIGHSGGLTIERAGSDTFTLGGTTGLTSIGADLVVGGLYDLTCYVAGVWEVKRRGVQPSFVARKTANQALVQGADTLITFDTEDEDNNNIFASNTAIPNIPGLWGFGYAFNLDGTIASYNYGKLFKNGSELTGFLSVFYPATSGSWIPEIQKHRQYRVTATTDEFKVYYNVASSTGNIVASYSSVIFYGYRLSD